MNVFDEPGTDRQVLRSALALAARGWHVFPCAAGGKRPALRGNWQDHATTDPGRIRAWWGRARYNIGIACGPSGLVVIDLDVPDGKPGEVTCARTASSADALAALCHSRGQPCPLPTYATDTPSGGCHLYYAAPARRIRNSAGRLGRLIDIRGDGGYVIGAASTIAGRAYTVRDEHPPMPLPLWITDLLEDKLPALPAAGETAAIQPADRGTAYAMAALREETRLVATARPGTRNETLNRAAFSLGQLATAGLLPPLAVITALASAAGHAGLPEQEARKTIQSGMTAGARKPRGSHPPVIYRGRWRGQPGTRVSPPFTAGSEPPLTTST